MRRNDEILLNNVELWSAWLCPFERQLQLTRLWKRPFSCCSVFNFPFNLHLVVSSQAATAYIALLFSDWCESCQRNSLTVNRRMSSVSSERSWHLIGLFTTRKLHQMAFNGSDTSIAIFLGAWGAVGEGADCRKHLTPSSWFGLLAQASQAFHPSRISELGTGVFWVRKTFTCLSTGHRNTLCKLSTHSTSTTYHASRVHGTPQKGLSNAVFYSLLLIVLSLNETVNLWSFEFKVENGGSFRSDLILARDDWNKRIKINKVRYFVNGFCYRFRV